MLRKVSTQAHPVWLSTASTKSSGTVIRPWHTTWQGTWRKISAFFSTEFQNKCSAETVNCLFVCLFEILNLLQRKMDYTCFRFDAFCFSMRAGDCRHWLISCCSSLWFPLVSAAWQMSIETLWIASEHWLADWLMCLFKKRELIQRCDCTPSLWCSKSNSKCLLYFWCGSVKIEPNRVELWSIMSRRRSEMASFVEGDDDGVRTFREHSVGTEDSSQTTLERIKINDTTLLACKLFLKKSLTLSYHIMKS